MDIPQSRQYHPLAILAGLSWIALTWICLDLLPISPANPFLLMASPVLATLAVLLLPQSDAKARLWRFAKHWLSFVALYAVVITTAVLIILLVCSAVGYLPYSDRPGPGWGHVDRHFPRLQEFGFFGGWALFFLMPALILWSSILFFFAAWLGWLGTPKWLLRVLGAIFCGWVALSSTAGAGWYIAIDPLPGNGAGITGLIFGAWVLPHFSGEPGSTLLRWKRAVLITVAVVGVAGFTTYPFWRNSIGH